jgi:hypothetical protein
MIEPDRQVRALCDLLDSGTVDPAVRAAILNYKESLPVLTPTKMACRALEHLRMISDRAGLWVPIATSGSHSTLSALGVGVFWDKRSSTTEITLS